MHAATHVTLFQVLHTMREQFVLIIVTINNENMFVPVRQYECC